MIKNMIAKKPNISDTKLNKGVLDFMLDFVLFQGPICNCNKQVLSTVSGSGSVNTNPFTHEVFGSSRVSTKHEHYTTFDIDNATFRCYGEYPFSDGDKVVLYASRTNEGYYRVENLKNFTRNYFIKYTAMSLERIKSSLTLSGGVPGAAFLFMTDSVELGISGALAGAFGIYMSVFRKARKKVAAFNKEIANYPEFK